jgi:hypothetical protein
MDQSPKLFSPSVTKKKKKRPNGSSLGRHVGRRTQKRNRAQSIIASFPTHSHLSPPNSVTTHQSDVTSASAFQTDRDHEKHLRNKANYAKRQCVKKQEQVEQLVVEQCDLEESLREQHLAHKSMKTNLESQLAITSASSSKVAASLSGRVTRLSRALVKEKDNSKLIKKTAKAKLNQLKHETQTALECKDDDLKSAKVIVDRVRRQGAQRANHLREQHKDHLLAKTNEHSIALAKLKEKSKSQVNSVRVQAENKLARSQRASSTSRNRLKVRR